MSMFILGLLTGGIATVAVSGIIIEIRQLRKKTRAENAVLNLPIYQLNVPPRVTNALRQAGVTTVGQVIMWRKSDLLKFRNFGVTSLKHLEHAIEVDLKITDWE